MRILNGSFFVATLLMAASLQAAPVKFDKSSGTITWTGSKQYQDDAHQGTVDLKEGSLDVAAEKGTFVIDMTTITPTDVKDADSKKKLAGHLSSDDFFKVSEFKDATIVVKDLAKDAKKPNEYIVTSDVTIRGKTSELKFPATITEKGGKTTLLANLVIDRTKFGVEYGAPASFGITDVSKFVEDKTKKIKDKVIKNDFKVDIKLTSI